VSYLQVHDQVSALLQTFAMCVSKTPSRDANSATQLGALTRFELARLIHPLHVDHVRVRPLTACDASFLPDVNQRHNWVDAHWEVQSVSADVSRTFSTLLLSVAGKVDQSERIFEYDVDVCVQTLVQLLFLSDVSFVIEFSCMQQVQ
jgi:hypothetical protein